MQILCATDFSASAARAADAAAAFAKALHLPLRIVHCMPNWPYMAEPMLIGDDGMLESWRKPLEAEAERLRSTGIEITSDLRRGDASHELIAAAKEHPTKLMVMGATGAGLAERWLLGRVAERVAESAPVSVLVVRQADLLLSWLKAEKSLRVLCGVDFNLASDAALTAVKELGNIGGLEVEAVHIREEKRVRFRGAVSGTARPEQDEDASEVEVGRDVWDRVTGVLGEPPTTVHVPRALRHADHEMVHLADEREAGLIVVGTHQRHGWQRLTHHSFSRGVLAHAATNVLCVSATSSPPAFNVPRLHRVLVATDLSAPGQDPLRYALGLLTDGGDIRLLHVIQAPETGVNPLLRSVIYFGGSMAAAQAQTAAQSALDGLISRLPATRNVRMTAEALIHEDIADGICMAAEKFGADVICMGTRGHSRTAAALRGSVLQDVTASGHRPVFVIPPPLP